MSKLIRYSPTSLLIKVPATVFAVSLLVGSLAVWNAHRIVTNNQRLHYESVRDLKAGTIQGWYRERQADISMLVQSEYVQNLCLLLADYELHNDVTEDGPIPVTDLEYLEIWDKVSFLDEFRQAYGYYDVFIIDPGHGHVQYTAIRESDLGTNLNSGPLKDSNLAKCWQTVIQTQDTYLTDFEFYEPSGNEPAQFLGAPLVHDGALLAVIVLQIPTDKLNEIMLSTSGMGDTGESFLVGSDYLLRSDSRHELQEGNTKTALFLNAESEQVRLGLGGHQGFLTGNDHYGVPVLAAYGQVDLLGQKYAIISEIHQSEAYSAVYRLAWAIGFGVLMLVVFSSWLAQVYSRLGLTNESLDEANEELLAASQELGETNAQLNNEIEERVMAEIEVRASEERFKRLSELAQEGVLIHEQGTIIDCNDAAAAMLGYSRPEMVGRNILENVPESERALVISRMQEQQEGHYETSALRKDGSTFPLGINSQHIPFQGRIVRVAAMQDLTIQKEHQQLALQQKELEAIRLTAATHAHEINNPLTGISGVLQVLSEENLDADSHTMVEDALQAVKRIKHVILQMEKMGIPKYRPYVGGKEILDLRDVPSDTEGK